MNHLKNIAASPFNQLLKLPFLLGLAALLSTRAFAAEDGLTTPFYQLAVFYVESAPEDPVAETEALFAEGKSDIQRINELPEGEVIEASYTLKVFDNPAEDYAPPSLDLLKYFGRGLTEQQFVSVQKSSAVQVMSFVAPKKNASAYYRSALDICLQLASRYNGYIWDENTRQLFTPEAWRESRLETWHKGLPDVRQHITIHSYREDNGVRAVTLGMDKFGLPDLVVDPISSDKTQNAARLMNVVAQRLLEGQWPKKGQLTVKLKALKHPDAKSAAKEYVEENGKGRVKLQLLSAEFEEGDVPNRQFRLDGNGSETGDIQRITSAVNQFFGYTTQVEYIKHTDRLKAASAAANAELPALQKRFQAGLEVGETLHIKGPFKTDDGGTEWMWVEVSHWPKGSLEGILLNQPRGIAALKPGASVTIEQADVFDYIFTNVDGSIEGNTTTAIIIEMQGS